MLDRHLREIQRSSKEVFRGRFLTAFQDIVEMPDGTSAVREYVIHPGAVMIVPLSFDVSGNLELIMERQFRYPVGRTMLEFPAGKLDEGESPLECARRELLEETGYSATEWARAGVVHPVIAYSTELIEIWFARGLIAGTRKLDEGEFLDVFKTSPQEVSQWCLNGHITDAKTICGVMWLQSVLNGSLSLDWRTMARDESLG